MNIYGQKVLLRAIEAEDNQMLLTLLNDPETERNLGGASFPSSSAAQKKWFDAQTGSDSVLRCVVAPKAQPQNGMGTVILSGIDRRNGIANVHIKLLPECRGQGFGTDAICAMVGYAFLEQRLNCVTAGVLSYNVTSQSLFEKCGFHKDGILRSRVYKGGTYVDVHSYSILKDEYHGIF